MTNLVLSPMAPRRADDALRKLARALLDADLVPSPALIVEVGRLLQGPDGEERLLRAMLRAELEQGLRWFAKELAR